MYIPNKYEIVIGTDDEMDEHEYSIDMYLGYDNTNNRYVCYNHDYNYVLPIKEHFKDVNLGD